MNKKLLVILLSTLLISPAFVAKAEPQATVACGSAFATKAGLIKSTDSVTANSFLFMPKILLN